MNISSILRAHPRISRLLVTRSLAVSLTLGGCVPATQWEEASSAAEVEAEGHRRSAERLHAAEAELERTKAENEKLSRAKAELEAQLQQEELQLARTSMDMESTKKEQEQQMELVTQLRGELARVGDHLTSYQGDKDDLTVKLSAAETQVSTLEAEVQRLRVKAESSEATQNQLRGAIKDLEGAEDVSDSADSADSEDDEKPSSNTNADSEDDENSSSNDEKPTSDAEESAEDPESEEEAPPPAEAGEILPSEDD